MNPTELSDWVVAVEVLGGRIGCLSADSSNPSGYTLFPPSWPDVLWLTRAGAENLAIVLSMTRPMGGPYKYMPRHRDDLI